MANLSLELERKCKMCGSTFRPKTLDSWYCSTKCGKAAYKIKKKEEKVNEQLARLMSLGTDTSAYIKVNEASQLYYVTTRTLYRLIHSGKLPSVKISPRNIRVSRLDLEAIFTKRPDEGPKQPKLYNMEPEACYTIGQICKKYKLDDSSVWAHIRKYSIPTRQIGNYVYAPKEDIDNLYTT